MLIIFNYNITELKEQITLRTEGKITHAKWVKHYIFTRPSLPRTLEKFRDLEYSYINCKKKEGEVPLRSQLCSHVVIQILLHWYVKHETHLPFLSVT